MRSIDYGFYRWVVITALVFSFGVKFALDVSLMDKLLSIVGLALTLVITTLYLTTSGKKVYWNEGLGVMIIERPWSFTVCSGRLIGSIPLSIQLEYSADKVLRAMDDHLDEGTELVWALARPYGNEPSRVGFVVERRKLKRIGVKNNPDGLVDKVLEDSMVLESAMRASYPHTKVVCASRNDMMLIQSGGIDTV